MVDISIRPEDNIIIESSHEEQNSTSHTTLIPNDQENNQFILPDVEIDQQGKIYTFLHLPKIYTYI